MVSTPARHRLFPRGAGSIALLSGGLAIAAGLLAAAIHPLAPVAAALGLGVMILVLARPIAGLYLFLAVITVLPFGVIPVQAGARLTFVDAALVMIYLAVAVRAGGRPGRVLGGVGWLELLVLGLACVAVAAFLLGTGYSPTTPELLRRFGKLLTSTLLFVVTLAIVRDPGTVAGLVKSLIVSGAIVGALGLGLWLLNPATQEQLLLSLRAIGYPTTDVLRYVPGANNTYTTQLRATGTAVDPNVFGGTVMLTAAMIAVQWASPEPLMHRKWLTLLAVPTFGALVASQSRGAWVGAATGILLLGTIRYRRLWLLAGSGVLLALLLPQSQRFVSRFAGGFSSSDPATALRFGEYGNALTIIVRYPFLGIGFGASPDHDVSAGVSSVYLLVGEQMGLLGLLLYVVSLMAIFCAAVRAVRLPAADRRQQGALSALLAAFTGALVAGLFDHYFANQLFPHAVALFWLLAALLVASTRLTHARLRNGTARLAA